MGLALHDFFASNLGRAVKAWLTAEATVNPAIKTMAMGDRLALAVPRVKAVFAGEVRWSEASPGDRAVWVGRSRYTSMRESMDENYQYYWENQWDTARLGPGVTDQTIHHQWADHDQDHGCVYMFGCRNIGYWHLCNQQTGGQLVGDHSMEIVQMYATVDRGLDAGELVTAELIIGHKIVSQATLADLVIGHPVGQHLPSRQGYSVRLAWDRITRPITVVVHLEGPSQRALM